LTCCCAVLLFPAPNPPVKSVEVLLVLVEGVLLNEKELGVEDPNVAGLFALLPKLKLLVEGEENVPKPVELFVVPEFPNEKELVDPELFDVLFPKLKEFEFPVLLLLLFDVLFPKLKADGELEGALKFPKVVVFELELLVLLLLLLLPNPVEKPPKEVVFVFPKAEGVEVDELPKEKVDGVLVADLFPNEKGELEVVFVEVFPKVDVEVAPNEKVEVFEGVVF